MPVRFTRRPARARLPSRLRAQLSAAGVKVKKPRRSDESDDQIKLFEDHIAVRLVPGAVAFAIPNGGKRARKTAVTLKREGATAGVPDIFAIHLSQADFLEMKKAKGGRVSKEQKDMMARLVGAGAICAVAAGLQAAIRQLEEWGLLSEAVAASEAGRMAA